MNIDDDLIDTSEAARIMGLADATLIKWRSTGENAVPFYKIGRSCRYRRSDLMRYIQQHIKNAGAEVSPAKKQA